MNAASFYQHRWLLIRLPLAVLALLLMVVGWRWLYPMPASRLTISTGLPDGAYHLHASRYAQAFARQGMQLDVLPSEGSTHNLRRLQAQPPDVRADLALVQGGFGWSSATSAPEALKHVQTLANVDVEGLWLFSGSPHLTSLDQLAGRTVAAGPEFSGHRVLLRRLLEQQGIPDQQVTWSPLSGLAAKEALVKGSVDAVFMVVAPASPAILALTGTPGIHLASLHHTSAIAEHNTFLENRLLPEGSLGQQQPLADAPLLTTPTHLLARADLDPALKRLAIAVAMEVHGEAGPFHRAGEYPALRSSDFPSAPQARSMLSGGLRGLEGLLPFWWAQVAQRLLVICLPILLLTALLSRIVPAWLRWRLESRVVRWYGELKFIENDLASDAVDVGGMELSRINTRLSQMERAIASLALPPELAERWYTLLHHVAFVRSHVRGYRGR